MTYRLIIAYDGGPFSGWQRQLNAPSVQQCVEEALSGLFGVAERVVVVGSGRTDAGVHANGQTVHLDTARNFPLDGLVHGSNSRLPQSVRVMEAHLMADGFHARRDATSKEYRYRLSQSRVLSPLEAGTTFAYRGALDVASMSAATQRLIGEYDFSAFAKTGGSQSHGVRRIHHAEWIESGKTLEFRVRGSGFLRGMVRALVGTLLEVGKGARAIDEFEALFNPPEGCGIPARAAAGQNVPARGLVLHEVLYDGWSALRSYP